MNSRLALTPSYSLNWIGMQLVIQECHKEYHLGSFREGQQMQRRFPRDEDGNYDPSNGTYLEEKTLLNVNFQKEMRAVFGVAMKLDERGCEHGV